MAPNGQPFENDDLLKLRSKQRALLASLPNDVFGVVPIADRVPEAELPVGQIEALLRRHAAVAIESNVPLFDVLSNLGEAQALTHWLRRTTINDWATAVISWAESVADSRAGLQINDDENGVLKLAVTLLVWADDVAGDYADPRAVAARARASAPRG